MTTDSHNKSITIIAPARLHLGFLDMHGGMNRKFGSLGLGLTKLHTHIQAKIDNQINISGMLTDRAQQCVEKIFKYFNINSGVNIEIHQAIPEHVGLGSGTQLSLAIGSAIKNLYQLNTSIHEIAHILNRGQRSGIGVGSFTVGGFIVDAGHGQYTNIPPIISHIPFPEKWRIVLLFDYSYKGLSGKLEYHAFDKLPMMSEEVSGKLCRMTLMQALPALVEHDCIQFGIAIQSIQETIGDYFKTVQQGSRYNSIKIASALDWFANNGAYGIGQSSWGPTGFALFPDETTVNKTVQKAKQKWATDADIGFLICQGRNQPANIIENRLNKNLK